MKSILSFSVVRVQSAPLTFGIALLLVLGGCKQQTTGGMTGPASAGGIGLPSIAAPNSTPVPTVAPITPVLNAPKSSPSPSASPSSTPIGTPVSILAPKPSASASASPSASPSSSPSASVKASPNPVVSSGPTAPVNLPPVVAMTSPVSVQTFTEPSNITVSASASSSVARVTFFKNGVEINALTSSPYSFTWTGVLAGSYTLTAVAVDNRGTQTTSAPILVVVKPMATPTPSPVVKPSPSPSSSPSSTSAPAAGPEEIDLSTAHPDYLFSHSVLVTLPPELTVSSGFVPQLKMLLDFGGEAICLYAVSPTSSPSPSASASSSFFSLALPNDRAVSTAGVLQFQQCKTANGLSLNLKVGQQVSLEGSAVLRQSGLPIVGANGLVPAVSVKLTVWPDPAQ